MGESKIELSRSQRKQWRVVPYRPQWPAMFFREASALERVFAPLAVRIEHVGSTAVVGLGAKPIIDIMIGVDRLDHALDRRAALESLGYRYVPEYEKQLPERRYFRKPAVPPRTHHLHIVIEGSAFWRDHLLFRDFLRHHPVRASAYYQLKVRLARQCSESGADYTRAKSAFIRSVLSRARRK